MTRIRYFTVLALFAAAVVGGVLMWHDPDPELSTVAAGAAISPGPAQVGRPVTPGRPVSPPATAPRQGPRVGLERLPEAAVGAPVGLDSGLVVTVSGLRSVQTDSWGPGEVVGEPAVAVDVELRNDASRPINLNQLAVEIVGPDGVPGMPSRGRANPLPRGAIQPGSTATATYVFRTDAAPADVVVNVSHGEARQIAGVRGR